MSPGACKPSGRPGPNAPPPYPPPQGGRGSTPPPPWWGRAGVGGERAQRRSVFAPLAFVILFVLPGIAFAQGPPAPSVPIDRQPYRIRVLMSAEPDARFDARRREALLA